MSRTGDRTAKRQTVSRVLLLNPPLRPEQVAGKFADWGGTYPPMGLCSLASVLREEGYEVSILDAEAERLGEDETVERIVRWAPDLVGLTCKSLWIKSAARVAARLKKRLPRVPLVAGGHHVTALPLLSLRDFPAFDIIVVGEGERTLLNLVETWNTGGDLLAVKGLALRDADGSGRLTAPRERIQMLDSLPFPAWDLLPDIPNNYRAPVFQTRSYPVFWWVTSRGCSGQCRFCDRTVFGNKVTRYGTEYVMTMARQLQEQYRFKHIMFDDDNFLVNRAHAHRLLDELERARLGFTFTCNSRVDTVDEETLGRLKRAGCWQITYGIESGSQRILDSMNKRIKVEQIERALRLTKKAGIRTYGFIIVGYPGETRETIKETYDLIRRSPIDDVGVFAFTPLPGSAIYDSIAEHGQFDEDWEKGNSLSHSAFLPEGWSEPELLAALERLLDACYLKWSQLSALPRRLTSPYHAKMVWKSLVKAI